MRGQSKKRLVIRNFIKNKRLKKVVSYACLSLLFLAHFSFLAAIFIESFSTSKMLLFSILSFLVIGIVYRATHRQSFQHKTEHPSIILFVVIGALLTYFIHISFVVNSVFSAALVGFLASFFPSKNTKQAWRKLVAPAVYCGTFIGMSHPEITGGFFFVGIAGLVSGVILMLSSEILAGFGGKLGSIAFGGVALTYLMFYNIA